MLMDLPDWSCLGLSSFADRPNDVILDGVLCLFGVALVFFMTCFAFMYLLVESHNMCLAVMIACLVVYVYFSNFFVRVSLKIRKWCADVSSIRALRIQ